MFSKLKEQPLYQDLNGRLILIGIFSSLGAMGFGFDNGWWGSALGLTEFAKKYGSYTASSKSWAIPSNLQSVGTGTGSAGIIIGCCMAPFLTSMLGRKRTLLVMASLLLTGITLEASAVTSFWQLVVGRIIVYSGIGLASNVVPMYQAECAPPRVRGAFLAFYSIGTSFGSFMATLTVFLSSVRSDKWQYLIVIICQLFVPVAIICSYPFLPESPRWLIYKGRYQAAEQVISLLYNNGNAAEEVELLKLQVEEQIALHKASSIWDCFKGTNLRRTIPAMGVQILQQAQGVSFIQNFLVTFMKQLGFSNALRSNVIVTGAGFAAHIVTFYTFDKLGRRYSLMLGGFLMAAMMMGVGGTTANGTANLSSSAQSGCVAMLILWYVIFGFTWGPGAWVVCAEMGTGQLRERTIFLASMGSFVTSVPINFVNPYVQAAVGGKVTFIYGAFSVVAVLFVFFMMPETRNRSLEELDEMFQAKVPTLKFNTYVCTGLGAEITQMEVEKSTHFKKEADGGEQREEIA